MATSRRTSLATRRLWVERGGEEGVRRRAGLGERLNGTANDENARTTSASKRLPTNHPRHEIVHHSQHVGLPPTVPGQAAVLVAIMLWNSSKSWSLGSWWTALRQNEYSRAWLSV